MNRRLDPEQPAPLKHIWRMLHCLSDCRPLPDPHGHWWDRKDEWHIDTGYCLDRPNTHGEMRESIERHEARTR